jgi:hypothetical protein
MRCRAWASRQSTLRIGVTRSSLASLHRRQPSRQRIRPRGAGDLAPDARLLSVSAKATAHSPGADAWASPARACSCGRRPAWAFSKSRCSGAVIRVHDCLRASRNGVTGVTDRCVGAGSPAPTRAAVATAPSLSRPFLRSPGSSSASRRPVQECLLHRLSSSALQAVRRRSFPVSVCLLPLSF